MKRCRRIRRKKLLRACIIVTLILSFVFGIVWCMSFVMSVSGPQWRNRRPISAEPTEVDMDANEIIRRLREKNAQLKRRLKRERAGTEAAFSFSGW